MSSAQEDAEPADRLEHLRRRWMAWSELAYPEEQYRPGSRGGEVQGVDLALAAGDFVALLDSFFTRGRLSEEELEYLRLTLCDLERALPSLADPGRAYFYEAAELLKAIRGGIQ